MFDAYDPRIILVLALLAFLALRFWVLLRPRTVRVRIVMPDGRSTASITRITREGDLRIGKASYLYNAKELTFEGLFKIPTLEYHAGKRAPIPRLTLAKGMDVGELEPQAAYDGITSHIMRELLSSFSDVFTPEMMVMVIGAIVLVVGGLEYYAVKQLVEGQTAILAPLIEASKLVVLP